MESESRIPIWLKLTETMIGKVERFWEPKIPSQPGLKYCGGGRRMPFRLPAIQCAFEEAQPRAPWTRRMNFGELKVFVDRRPAPLTTLDGAEVDYVDSLEKDAGSSLTTLT